MGIPLGLLGQSVEELAGEYQAGSRETALKFFAQPSYNYASDGETILDTLLVAIQDLKGQHEY